MKFSITVLPNIQAQRLCCGRCGHGRTTFDSSSLETASPANVEHYYVLELFLKVSCACIIIITGLSWRCARLCLTMFMMFQESLISHAIYHFQLVGLGKPVQSTGLWFNRFKWIHYDVPSDAVFCHVCCKVIKEKVVKVSGVTEASFLRDGYTNWKDATRNFGNHEKTKFH